MSYLKKSIMGNKIYLLIDSSNILMSEYDYNEKTLIITFMKGSRYKYNGVSNEVYTKFQQSDSQGKFFNQHIKNLEFEKLEKSEDFDRVLESVNKLKESKTTKS